MSVVDGEWGYPCTRPSVPQVIPVTPKLGMIEWVRDTRPLKGVIEEGLGVKLPELPAQYAFVT